MHKFLPIFCMCMPLGILFACQENRPASTTQPSTETKLQGNWESVLSIGGGRRISTDDAHTGDHNHFLQIKDSVYKLWIDDSLYTSTTFKLDTTTFPEDTAPHFFMRFANGHEDETVYFRHDSLLINPEVIASDRIAFYYLPTTKATPVK